MSGYLLLVLLMYSLPQLKAQALPPPTLSVNPAVITETDSVALNCQTPSSHAVPECYYNFIRGQPAEKLPCRKTLTGTELLRVTHQKTPAQVEVTCFYLYASQSPRSEKSSIIIRTSLPPTLTVNTPEISETDSVTLNCQPPSSASVSQCHFYSPGGGPGVVLSCLQTLTGSELLRMSGQSSPAQVKLSCFYTEKLGEEDSPSPHSAVSSIRVHSLKPTLSRSQLDDGLVLFVCSLPVSAAHGTKCNLYFGEASDPGKTKVISNTEAEKTKSSICQFYFTFSDLMSQLSSVQPKDARCDYTLGSEPNPLSPRSNRYSLAASLPPTLTVNPAEISETDSVTLNCQPPSSASVSQCHFYSSGGGPGAVLSCLQTLTGSELLRMSGQSSPALIKLSCFYTEKLGEEDSPSPHSAVSSIRVHSLKPTLSRSHFDDGLVLLVCSLPVSAAHGTKCNLYFGGASHPAKTKVIFNTKAKKQQSSICQFYFTTDDLMSQLRSVQPKDASCDYTLGSEPNPLSPRSNRYSLMDIVEKESNAPRTTSTSTTTTGRRPGHPPAVTSPKNTQVLTVSPSSNSGGDVTSPQTTAEPTSETDVTSLDTETITVTGVSVVMPDSKDSGLPETPLKKPSKNMIWKFVAAAAGCGVTVGVVLLVSAVVCNKRRAGPREIKKKLTQCQMDDLCHYSTCYSIVSYEPAVPSLGDRAYSTTQTHYTILTYSYCSEGENYELE